LRRTLGWSGRHPRRCRYRPACGSWCTGHFRRGPGGALGAAVARRAGVNSAAPPLASSSLPSKGRTLAARGYRGSPLPSLPREGASFMPMAYGRLSQTRPSLSEPSSRAMSP
jgi:hypothetical protein